MATLSDVVRRAINRLFAGPGASREEITSDPAAAQRMFNTGKQMFANTMSGQVDSLMKRREGDLRAITPRVFGENLMTELRALGTTALAASAGGLRNVRPQDFAQVLDPFLDRQRGFMFRWVAQLEREPEKWSQAAILNRVLMYAASAESLLSEMRHRVAYPKLPPLPFHPKDRTQCRGNCLCGWDEPVVVDAARGDYTIRWLLDQTGNTEEHCITCLKRAEVCNPLVIRGGIIVTPLSDPGLYA